MLAEFLLAIHVQDSDDFFDIFEYSGYRLVKAISQRDQFIETKVLSPNSM